MNWLDYTILAIIGLSVLISVWRGFAKEALSLAAWIVAIMIAFNYADNLHPFLEPHIQAPSIRKGIAFAILFVVTLLLAGLVNFLLLHLFKKTGLSGTDRMLGIFFGVVRGCLVVAVLVLFLGFTPVPQDPWWKESQLMHYFVDMAIWLRQFFHDDIAKHINF